MYKLPDFKIGPWQISHFCLTTPDLDFPSCNVSLCVCFRYVQYNTVSMESAWTEFYQEECDCACKHLHLCAIQYIDNDPFEACRIEAPRTTCTAATCYLSWMMVLIYGGLQIIQTIRL